MPPTAFGHSEVTAPLRYRQPLLSVSGAVIIAIAGDVEPRSWCDDCCVGDWYCETSDLGPVQLGSLNLPLHCFHFSNAADLKMFSFVFSTNMKLALEVVMD